jgi:hypothetical protein
MVPVQVGGDSVRGLSVLVPRTQGLHRGNARVTDTNLDRRRRDGGSTAKGRGPDGTLRTGRRGHCRDREAAVFPACCYRQVGFLSDRGGRTAAPRSLGAPRPGLVLLPYPDPYRPVLGVDPAETVLEYLHYLFETICPPDEVAAVMIEPIQSDGGLIVPPPGFLKGLTDRCRSTGSWSCVTR